MERSDERSTIRIIPAGSGVELHPVCIGQAEELYAAIERNRDRLRQWLPWVTPDYSIDHAARFLSEKASENAAGTSLTATVTAHGTLAGAIAFHRIDRLNRSASIGYWLDAAHQGRGIMTQACRALVEEGFRAYDLHRLEIRCATANQSSSAIPRRLGFNEEGILREAEWLHDHWIDLRVFALLEQDWRER